MAMMHGRTAHRAFLHWIGERRTASGQRSEDEKRAESLAPQVKVKDRQDRSARSLCWTGGPSSDDREKWKEIEKPRTTSTDGEN
ncbi:hypothetical protein THAOC_01558 [Thalassiosira oceanica]|uniref:Uncharacterized protein n=1 Tax=Thalassiosira oceanica TaxID=159749 RepID=K0TI36_THAOC|nr:hypothetical protein THAOC_01558 [Thalassiosira oceanica]|eukprot:EJK76664.1 hypothetical protein THAOC_01558 [Thalassiosira oceanica]